VRRVEALVFPDAKTDGAVCRAEQLIVLKIAGGYNRVKTEDMALGSLLLFRSWFHFGFFNLT
jgi:hypothetical protein